MMPLCVHPPLSVIANEKIRDSSFFSLPHLFFLFFFNNFFIIIYLKTNYVVEFD